MRVGMHQSDIWHTLNRQTSQSVSIEQEQLNEGRQQSGRKHWPATIPAKEGEETTPQTRSHRLELATSCKQNRLTRPTQKLFEKKKENANKIVCLKAGNPFHFNGLLQIPTFTGYIAAWEANHQIRKAYKGRWILTLMVWGTTDSSLYILNLSLTWDDWYSFQGSQNPEGSECWDIAQVHKLCHISGIRDDIQTPWQHNREQSQEETSHRGG